MTHIRKFETGATRNDEAGKFDFEGFLAPTVEMRFAEYMHNHRQQVDGTLRASDNWQKGIPLDAYMKSGFRHFMDWWSIHRGLTPVDAVGNDVTLEDALCALRFNVSGYLFETLKRKTSMAV